MKGQMLKLFVVVTMCLLIAAGCVASPPPPTPVPVPPTSTPVPPSPTPVPPTPAPDLTAPVKAWVDTLNSGDVDAALALFTDDVKFSVFEYIASNKDGLRGIFDWLAGLETKYQITECQPKGDRVVCTMPGSRCLHRGLRRHRRPADDDGVFLPGGWQDLEGDGKLEDGEWDTYYAKWITPATTWMQANRAEESRKGRAARRPKGGRRDPDQAVQGVRGEPKGNTNVAAADPLIVVKAWEDALNQDDVEAYVALFADQFDASVM